MSTKTSALTDAPAGMLPALIRESQLAKWLGVHKRTIFDWQRRGLLPEPIKFGPANQSTKAWVLDDIRDWLDAKRSAARETGKNWEQRLWK
jgi:predicted DNA-binding transcriptional regulator AlpA